PSRETLLVLALCLFFTDPAATETYPLSLHDALPICRRVVDCFFAPEDVPTDFSSVEDAHRALVEQVVEVDDALTERYLSGEEIEDRKSTRLNSSHVKISYAVFCLKKKKNNAPTNDKT